MTTRLGADPAELRRLAAAIERAGEGLEDDARGVGRRIAASGWDGADAARYRSAWDTAHRPALLSVAKAFADAARQLRDEATAQEKASGVDGGTAGGADEPPGSGTGGFDGDTVLPRPESSDQDGDGVTDDVDPDKDGDGVTDTDDTDHDGVPDFRDEDDDGDGQPDRIDDKIDVGVTLGEVEGSWQFLGDQGSASTTFAGGLGAAEASGWYGGRVDGEASAGVDEEGNLVAEGSVEVAVGAGGEASASVGNDYAAVAGTAAAFVGARATADGTLTVGPDGVGMEAGVEAFAGAEASAEASATVLGVTGGAEVSGYAGVGVKASADLALGWDKTELDVELGAALGLGGGISFSVDFSPKDTVAAIEGLADDLGDLLPDLDLTPW
ncbi:WXG100 family type VII secretion target [Xylanimonas protaetiae]|uniref:WXG100 family type VII secretion target n=1 Tax=Xylanimonas protaetiae TaxID=2509457 RepID=A0A4P6FH57_9MICO|nr:WXG100 family type VII secretion target [Xylanimonas protaetiae]QAY69958.1 WXG100 family type VII secretion target [Xylanimonas protaetiae]